MRRIRSQKTLSLGMPKAPQGNIQGRLKLLSLGMPRKASPLSSSKLSVYLTRSYIFIRHMICVWLGVYCMILVIAFQITTVILSARTFWEKPTCLEFIRILYVLHLFLLSQILLLQCFTYIFLEHGGGFLLQKFLISNASLILF